MNIIYLSSSIITSQKANSIQVMKNCDALSELGHKITLFARSINNKSIKSLKEIKELSSKGSTFFYRDNFIYRVSSGSVRRIIAVYKHNFLHELNVFIREDDFEQKDNWSDDEHNSRYILQHGCKLVRIE